MIFKTIQDELGQNKIAINDTFKGLFDGSLFEKHSVLSDDDISALKAYNAEIERGVSPMTAYYRTMQNASEEAVNMAKSANESTVEISKIPKASKAAELRMKALSVALSVGVTLAATIAIKLLTVALDNMADSAEDVKNRLEDNKSVLSDYTSKIDELKEKLEELNNTNVSYFSQAKKDELESEKQYVESQIELYEQLKEAKEKAVADDYIKATMGKNEEVAIKQLWSELTSGDIEGLKDTGKEVLDNFNMIDYVGLWNGSSTTRLFDKVDDGNYFSEADKLIEKYTELNEKYVSLQRQSTEGANELLTTKVDETASEMTQVSGEIAEIIDQIDAARTFLMENNDSGEYTEEIEQMTAAIEKYQEVLTGNIHASKYTGFNELQRHLLGLRDVILVITEDIEDFPGIELIKGAFDNLITMLDVYKTHSLKELFSLGIEEIARELNVIKDAFKDFNVLDTLKDKLKDVLPEEAIEIWHDLENAIGFAKEKFEEFFNFIASTKVGSAIIQSFETIGTAIQNIFKPIEDFINKYEYIFAKMKKAWDDAHNRDYSETYDDDRYADLVKRFGKENIDKLSEEDLEIAYKIENVGDMTFDDLQAKIQEVKNASKEDVVEVKGIDLQTAKAKVLGDSESGVTGLKDEFALLQEVLADTKKVSIETYESLIEKSDDYSRALKIEAGQIVVDNQKLKMINKTRTESIKKEVKEASTLKKLEWINNAKKLQQYNFQQNDLNEGIWETCNALQDEISQFDLLVQGIDAASNAFTNFQDAQNAAESGDYFDIGLEMADAFQKGIETGKIGTPEFIAAMQGAMDENLFSEIINMDDAKAQFDAIQKFYDDVYSQYFIKGEDAEYDISGLDNFAKKAASFKDEYGNAKYATYKNGDFSFIEDVNMDEFAKDMQLNAEMVYAILGEMEEYSIGDSFLFKDSNLINEHYNKMSKLTDAQQLYNEALESGSENQITFAKKMLETATQEYEDYLSGLGDKVLGLEKEWQENGEGNQSFGEYLKSNYTTDEFVLMYSTATERAEQLRKKMHELEVSGRAGSTEWKKYNDELEKLDEAISAIDNTTEKQELLNEAVQATKEQYTRLQEIMEALEDPELDGKSMEKLKQEAYELIAALGELPRSIVIEFEAKKKDLEEKLDTVTKEKEKFAQQNSGIQDTIYYRGRMSGYEAEVNSYQEQIQEINAILNLDVEDAKAKLEEVKSEDIDKEGTVNYSPDFSACNSEKAPTLDGIVKYKAEFEDATPPGGGKSSGGGKSVSGNSVGFNGVPQANGTFNAFATGTGAQVSIPKNEKALVNELGEEGLVRNGKLIPIKGGAQLIDLKKGDIIFNHKQMEDLKKHGYTTGRGKMIGGTDGIIGAHFNGTIPAYNSYNVSGGVNFSNGTKSVTGSNRSGKDSNNNEVKEDEIQEEKELTEELLDWIERRVKKLQRFFDRWVKNAETALTSDFITKYYNKARKNLNKQLDTQSKAYSRYLEEANKSGLSDDYKKKVRDGLIDIETITDDDLKEQISKYQEYFDKANESLTAFEEAAEQRFNIPLDKATKRIEKFSEAIDLLDKKLDNAIGSKAKNKLIDKQTKEEKKTLKANKKAKKDSASNLKAQGKKMKSKDVLSSPDVSKSEKKKIKKAVKNKKEIDISYFQEGSKAYQQAVKYNEALKANTQAQYDFNVANEEYKAWLVEASKMKFDNIADEYENTIKQFENSFTDIDNKIAEIEAVGKRVDKSLYESQKNINDQELAKLKAELVALEESKKDIKQGTDEWFEALDAIQEVENSISDCIQETAKLNNAITELHYRMISDMADGIDRIIKEQDLLQELFSHKKLTDDDTGNFTDAGIAKLGSLTAQYYATQEKIDLHKKEKENLEYMKANNLLSYSDGYISLKFNSEEEREAKYNQVNDWIMEDYSEAYNKEKELFDIMNERYQAELSYIKQLIDDQKEALQRQKDLHDYQNTINEKVNNIDTLQRQISAYSGDSSQEGMAKLQKLQKELNDAQKDLQETEYDRYISDQQDMLDKFYEDYEETITNQLEDFKGIVKEAIVNAEENMANIDKFLKTVAKENGYEIESDELFNGMADNIADNVSDAVSNVVDTIQDSASDGDDDDSDSNSGGSNGNNSSGNNGNQNSTTTSTPQTMPTIPADNTFSSIRPDQIKDEWETKREEVEAIFGDSRLYKKGDKNKTYKTEINKYLMKKNKKVLSNDGLKALRKALGTNNAGLYDAMVELKKHIKGHVKNVGGFKTGGIAKLVKSRGEDGLMLARNGEGFVSPEHVPAIQELLDTVPLMNNMFKPLVEAPKLPNLTPVNNAANNILQIDTLTLPNVTNYEEFRDSMYKDMQSNKKFEGMIRDMSINQVSGGGRLSKYNKRF